MKRIVILGAGTGGAIIANRLYRKLWRHIKNGEIRLTVVEPNKWHYYQPGYLLLPLNLVDENELRRPVRTLIPDKIELMEIRADKIDPENNSIVLNSGEIINYDYLVISTGSTLNKEEVAGLSEGSHNFYNYDDSIRLREAIRKFNGGTVVVGVAGFPYKCPPAPIEMTLLLDSYFRKMGIRDKVDLHYIYPLPRVFPIPEAAETLDNIMRNRNINIHLFFSVDSIDLNKKAIYSIEGETLKYDLSILVPPHKGAQVIINSGLGDEDGWIPTNRHTLNMLGYENVYVVGDATNLPISKAGSVADFEAEVITRRLVDQINGYEPTAIYDGRVMCFVLTGIGEGMLITFDYNNPPKPRKPTFINYWLKLVYNKLYWSITASSNLLEVHS